MSSGSSALRDALAVIRFPITLIGMTSTVAMGWLLTQQYLVGLALFVGIDWFLINLMNRVTDIEEDLRNEIRGTEGIARRRGLITAFCFALQIGSIVASHLIWPALTPFRVAVQAIGLGYNYNLVPTPRGFKRFKELYFFKNFGSSCIFALTSFAYPIAATGTQLLSSHALWALILFFIPFEMTYEILYDLRDYRGDKAEGIPTFPVVHGEVGARKLVDALLLFASLVLAVSLSAGWIGVREALMLAAPPIQFFAYRALMRRHGRLSPSDCILLTHLGSFLLCFFLAGNRTWLALGLPANIHLEIFH
jgi:4-hydroxybenzoate polyprenyltransferase